MKYSTVLDVCVCLHQVSLSINWLFSIHLFISFQIVNDVFLRRNYIYK